ncbi:MAG TPA: bifunctional diguanylate cyclase/phosphodiesterase [Sphingomonas sp.]|nr:bifunctional diguanylate cyclase/phosphodiesterase [Sphingomonas sp.]
MTSISDRPAAGSSPLFLLSFRERDALARMAERAGWSAIAARRVDRLEQRFLASGAAVAVIDAREMLAEGLAAARLIADAAEANGAALLMLIGRRESSGIAAAFEAGATHYLLTPFGEREFAQALRFAQRHADRLAGGHRAAGTRAAIIRSETMLWRWTPGKPHQIALSGALAATLGFAEEPMTIGRGRAAALLGREGVRAAAHALARLEEGAREEEAGGIAAFAHAAEDGRRIAHHLVADSESGERIVIGHVETLDGARADAAPRDPLTGLDDAHGARRWIEARLAQADDAASPIVLILGLNRFEMVNAAFGRVTGDAILRGVARRIERLVGRGTARRRLVARLAGAEFVIGLPSPVTQADAELLATELVAAVGRPFVAGEHVVSLTARAGIAAAAPGETEAGPMLRRASLALADARGGDARVRMFEEGEEADRAEARRLELDLRRALDEDRIDILWQPQVAIAGGGIVGVEALARGRHATLGEIGAEALFAAAERSDYLCELSRHVQRKALAEAALWPETLAGLRVAINVTAADIAEPDFAETLLGMADEAGLARERLTVEVTESGLIEDLGAAAGLLAELRRGGVRVAIDDFGTGYSSLAYLKALPLDYLKIDRSLAQDIAGSARDRIVVRSVIDMARSLGLAVVAEGVETEEQLTLLAREGCNYYQGFLCSPPVDTSALEALVER